MCVWRIDKLRASHVNNKSQRNGLASGIDEKAKQLEKEFAIKYWSNVCKARCALISTYIEHFSNSCEKNVDGEIAKKDRQTQVDSLIYLLRENCVNISTYYFESVFYMQ